MSFDLELNKCNLLHITFGLFLITMTDYGVDKYDIGSGFGHFGVAVEDVSYYILIWSYFFLHKFIIDG